MSSNMLNMETYSDGRAARSEQLPRGLGIPDDRVNVASHSHRLLILDGARITLLRSPSLAFNDATVLANWL